MACALAGWLTAVPAQAESNVVLPMPSDGEAVAATTFDDRGQAVGSSSFALETIDAGLRHMKIEMAVDGGGVNRSEATLAPVVSATVGQTGRTVGLRLIEQRSQATRADGGPSGSDGKVVPLAGKPVAMEPKEVVRRLFEGDTTAISELQDAEPFAAAMKQYLLSKRVSEEDPYLP